MDYQNLTAPCGRDCFNCYFYLATKDEKCKEVLSQKLGLEPEKVLCNGCRNIKGECKTLKNYGFSGSCKIYQCVCTKNVEFCSYCSDFPCDLLHPLADRAERFPHNLKVYNLCMIKKMGLENWAKTKSKHSFQRYYNDKLDSCM
ncbi:MAG: DUF3795 domain-containing protein [Bacteroidales bacterium]|nr:DUF3795 domain-containing protein [Bacteroidales bacterium]MDD4529659.1 DUF3795 domain-containing protein [Bacteroidales bacterium]MDD4829931.1 DUF3795 domain-containing protein [Bacteroidales bacterium]